LTNLSVMSLVHPAQLSPGDRHPPVTRFVRLVTKEEGVGGRGVGREVKAGAVGDVSPRHCNGETGKKLLISQNMELFATE